MGREHFHTTMSKLTLISTFWLLIGAAMVSGTPVDQTDQVRVNVEVNTGPKAAGQLEPRMNTDEESLFYLKLQELKEKAEKGYPFESEATELAEEAKKNPKLMKMLQRFIQEHSQNSRTTLKKKMVASYQISSLYYCECSIRRSSSSR